MKNIGYVFKQLPHMNYKAACDKLRRLHEKTSRSYLKLSVDMASCAVKHGAGYMDYDLFEMYNLTEAQRSTYLTRGRNNALVKKYNDESYAHYFNNKNELDAKFNDYLKRDWVSTKENSEDEIRAFMDKHPRFIAKPINGECGKGVEKIDLDSFPGGAQAAYRHLTENETGFVLEELIKQHPAVSAIYPNAVNSVRVVTITKDGKTNIICTYFRIGNNGKPVDNFNSGGMVAPVDKNTGIVTDRAIDKQKRLYSSHPQTGAPIKGFQFPFWDDALELVRQAAKEVPKMAYIGWDIAFGENGPQLIEGNDFPGHDIYQLPEHTPNKIGILPEFEKI